jgi:hypothetical protein
MFNWLMVGGFLTDKPLQSLTGVVKLDATPMLRGMVILTPIDQPGAPPVVVYISNTGTGELGRFTVSANNGLVMGKYRVEVRQDAVRWISNSRDPFMIKMTTKQKDKTLTEEDLKDWGSYLRKRDMSPSIYNQHVFSKQHPKDEHNYTIETKRGSELLIEVFSK